MSQKKEINKEWILLQVLLLVAAWVFAMGWVIPTLVKFASTLILFITAITAIIGAYYTVKYLVKLYKDINP